ncbi:hypothetical protein TrCOL_g5303 [Triparma columacea]|uniref:Uncharacterized protein n=1 Tax=Triparma columacea TaxID=722753 RepID=A0A9W7LEY4_9STRA|nr:hypothetical protein TrCOL_g5303 [Triparma columacea]
MSHYLPPGRTPPLPFGNPVVNSEVCKTLNKTFSLPACCDRDQTTDPCTGAEAAEKISEINRELHGS